MTTTDDRDPWLSLQDGPDDDAVFIRALRAPPADRSRFPALIIAAWPYDLGDDKGLPDRKTYEQMHAFQEAVHTALTQTGAGLEAATLLGRGVKEWRYYAADPEAFLDVFNKALAALPEFPLEMQSFDDPDWDGLTELLP